MLLILQCRAINIRLVDEIKTSNVTGQVAIDLDYVASDGGTYSGDGISAIGEVTGTQDWTYYQSSVFTLPTMPSNAVALWFLFDFNAGAGTAWFDDVALSQINGLPRTPSPTITTIPILSGTTSVSGTAVGNAAISLMINGGTPYTITANSSGTWNIANLPALSMGNVISVTAQMTGQSVSVAAKATVGTNILINPGFENGLTGWSTSTGTAVYTIDSTAYHSGSSSVKGVETNTKSLGRLYQDVTDITMPGNQYQISGWIKTSNVTGQVAIDLDYVASDGGTYSGDGISAIGEVTGTQDWTYYQSPVFTLPTMPSNAIALWFLFDFNAGAGTAWFDDVSLLQISGAIPTPVILSFLPTSGGVGTTVTITGTGFTGVTAVSFGGTAAQTFKVNTDTQITATVGNGATGDIRVTTPGGTASSAGTFSFTQTSTPSTPASVTLISIAVTPGSPSNLAIGSTQQFTAMGSYSDGSQQNITSKVPWSSSNMNVASISSNGLATGLAAGNTGITASMAGVTSKSIALNIITVAVTSQIEPLYITTTSLNSGELRVFYWSELNASGGIAPYNWIIFSNAQAINSIGLTLSSDGMLNGTPSNFGPLQFIVQVQDATGMTESREFTLSIGQDPNIVSPGTAGSLPDATQGILYSHKLQGQGGVGPYNFYIYLDSLPPGLNLSLNGLISGCPTSLVTNDDFVVMIQDSLGGWSTQILSITVVLGTVVGSLDEFSSLKTNPIVTLNYNGQQNTGELLYLPDSTVELNAGIHVGLWGTAPPWFMSLVGVSYPWYSVTIAGGAGGPYPVIPFIQLGSDGSIYLEKISNAGTPEQLTFTASPTSQDAISADIVSIFFYLAGQSVTGPAAAKLFNAAVSDLDEEGLFDFATYENQPSTQAKQDYINSIFNSLLNSVIELACTEIDTGLDVALEKYVSKGAALIKAENDFTGDMAMLAAAINVGDLSSTYTIATLNDISITSIQNGKASLVQGDGVTVNINGAAFTSDGTNVTVNSANYGTSQPSGIGAIQLNGTQYYDVNLNSSSGLGPDAVADVTIANSSVKVNSTMRYWYNGVWNTASNISINMSISPPTITGDIPIKALGGTPVVIGTTGILNVRSFLVWLLVGLAGAMVAAAVILFRVRWGKSKKAYPPE